MLRMSESDAEDQSLDATDSPENGEAPSASEVRLVHAARNGDHDAFVAGCLSILAGVINEIEQDLLDCRRLSGEGKV